MGIILDLIVLAIIGICIFLSARHGFVRTLIEIVGFLLVIFLANNVSPIISEYTYNKVIEPAVVNSVEGLEINTNTDNVPIDESILPPFLTNILGDSVDINGIKQSVENNISNGITSAVKTACDSYVKPTVIMILDGIITLILSFLLFFVVKLLAKIVNKFFSFSIAGKLNRLLGGILGIPNGIINAVIICSIIALLVTANENGIWIFTRESIESSYLFKLLCIKF